MVMVASACLISSKICDQDGKLITKSDALALGRYCCNFVGGAVTAAAGSEAAKTKWRESVKALKDAAMVVKGKYKDMVARCTAKDSKVNQWGWKGRNSEKIEKVDQWTREEASSKETGSSDFWTFMSLG
ncbi:unnamed protein product [Clonostachys rosea f. rosea IK726]|uniref:Uncharacterized protein n=1 Tax=Clonostachys rosea f. rosea IK726 TaxID=1349383 RepID=A0ACA9UJE8_BIOOC|nr:unnamed protein product [Clonostachys rosea f. rosea IK726]